MLRALTKSLLLAFLTLFATTSIAFAYVDPATGGMLFQALAAALAVFTGLALVFSRQIRMLFARVRRSLRRGTETEEHDAQAETTAFSEPEEPGDR
jgi:hypothetical protein